MDTVMYMGEVLHDETREHDADVQQDGLHGVVADEVVELGVAHHRQEQGEEGHEGDEGVGVEDLQQRRDEHRNLERPREHHERLVGERDGAHARDEVRQAGQDPPLEVGADLWLWWRGGKDVRV